MVCLKSVFDTSEDLKCLVDTRFIYFDRLETSLKRSIFLEILSVLFECGRTDGMEFTTCQCRLEDVRCIHTSFTCTRTYDGVDLIDEENDVRSLFDLVNHSLESVLKLPSVFRSGDQTAHIKRDDSHVLKAQRYFFIDDTLCKPFNDSRFTCPRLTYKNRIILGLSDEDLHYTLYLFVSSYDRVKLSVKCFLVQVDPVLCQCFKCLVTALRIDLLSATDGFKGFPEFGDIDIFAQDISDETFIGIGKQPCIHCQILVSIGCHDTFGILQ